MLSSCSIKKKKKLEQRAISTNFRLHRYSTLFSNRIHPPLAIFYFLLCMIPVTLQTSTKPVNRETYVTEVARFIPLIYIYGGGSTSIIVFHASASFFFFFRPPHDRTLHFLNPFHRAEDYFTILRCHGISCVYDATLTWPGEGEGKNGGRRWGTEL